MVGGLIQGLYFGGEMREEEQVSYSRSRAW